MQNPNSAARGEAEHLLAIAEQHLQSRDLVGARDFAILAQENEPLMEGSDQILAVSEVLISSEKRVNDHHHDWYSILQIDHKSDDIDLIRKQYRRLALLLHPEKNKFPFADHAFQLVADAWATLSDPSRKSLFDQLLVSSSRDDLAQSQFSQSQEVRMDFSTPQRQKSQQHEKLPVRRGESDSRSKQKGSASAANSNGNVNLGSSFWTACPYCYVIYEYPKDYEECCLKCQSCERVFHGAEIPALPPLVPGKEGYYCCWAFFPVGFKSSEYENGGKRFPNWMPPMVNSNGGNVNSDPRPRPVQQNSQTPLPRPQTPAQVQQATQTPVQVQHATQAPTQVQVAVPLWMDVEMSFGVQSASDGTKKKRGRPRKNPL